MAVVDLAHSLRWMDANATVAGVGLDGFFADPDNLEPATLLCVAAGL